MNNVNICDDINKLQSSFNKCKLSDYCVILLDVRRSSSIDCRNIMWRERECFIGTFYRYVLRCLSTLDKLLVLRPSRLSATRETVGEIKRECMYK